MNTEIEIEWLSENEKELFQNAGFVKFADFWNLENSGAAADFKHIRQHINRRTGEIKRQVTCVRINKIKYYLKRSRGTSYNSVLNEFDALKVLPDFGLATAKLLAFGFNEKNKMGFLLYKNLSGYYSLEELVTMTAPPAAIADFQTRKKSILKKITATVNKICESGYFYPDWHGKHIYIKINSDDIVLIDLERFLPSEKCPWYYKSPLFTYWVRHKEWKALRRALGSGIYTRKFLGNLLREK